MKKKKQKKACFLHYSNATHNPILSIEDILLGTMGLPHPPPSFSKQKQKIQIIKR